MPETRRDLGLTSLRLGRLWRGVLNAELAKFGLTGATWRPLFYLGRNGDGSRPRDLAEALNMERPSLGELLDRLEQQGFLRRQPGLEDRRTKTLHLTEKGREVYDRTLSASVAVGEALTAGISDDDLDRCLSVFARIHENAASMSSVPILRHDEDFE